MTAIELSPVRIGRITASRVPKILGLSPWGNRDDAMREMVREYFGDKPEFTGNFITDYGHEHEPEAVAEYEMSRGVAVRAAGAQQETVVHPVYDFLASTPDGLVDDDGLVETKCPWRAPYSHVNQRPDYQVQIRTQLECTQRSWGDLAVWRQGEPIAVSRMQHEPEWLPSVLDEFKAFIDEFQQIIEDEELAAPYRAPLVDVRLDPEWSGAASHYLELLYLRDQLDADLTLSKDELILLAGDARSTRGNHVLLTASTPSGRIDYKKALEHFAPMVTPEELEPFRGPGGRLTHTVRKSAK